MQYIYQKKWMNERWKDYHILTSLYSDEEDTSGSAKVEKKEKETYEFELTSIDPSHKIKIIKTLRELLGLGLKDAKDIVDKAPYVFKKGKK
jgi:ribosomal protein L7/L12